MRNATARLKPELRWFWAAADWQVVSYEVLDEIFDNIRSRQAPTFHPKTEMCKVPKVRSNSTSRVTQAHEFR